MWSIAAGSGRTTGPEGTSRDIEAREGLGYAVMGSNEARTVQETRGRCRVDKIEC